MEFSMKRAVTKIVVICTLTLSGCTYNAVPDIAPAVYVPSTVGARLPGKFFLVVESDEMNKNAEVGDLNCSANRYAVNAKEVFEQSVIQTIEKVVEQVEFLASPASKEAMIAKKARGQITVRAEEFVPQLLWDPGVFNSAIESVVDVSARISVDGAEGVLFSSTIDATRQAKAASSFCSEGAKVAGEASSLAIQELMERLAEELGNSATLRQAM